MELLGRFIWTVWEFIVLSTHSMPSRWIHLSHLATRQYTEQHFSSFHYYARNIWLTEENLHLDGVRMWLKVHLLDLFVSLVLNGTSTQEGQWFVGNLVTTNIQNINSIRNKSGKQNGVPKGNQITEYKQTPILSWEFSQSAMWETLNQLTMKELHPDLICLWNSCSAI